MRERVKRERLKVSLELMEGEDGFLVRKGKLPI